MQPTLLKGDRILVNRRIYKSAEPKRGDVVVFRSPVDPKLFYISRLAGLPGERIEIRDGKLLIDGKATAYPSGKNPLYVNRGPYGEQGKPVTVPAGHYYVLGDNSPKSRDSRYFGFISRESLIGEAYKIYYPFDRSGALE